MAQSVQQYSPKTKQNKNTHKQKRKKKEKELNISEISFVLWNIKYSQHIVSE